MSRLFGGADFPVDLGDGVKLIGERMDPMHDAHELILAVAIDGRTMRNASVSGHVDGIRERLHGGLRHGVDMATLEQRYLQRPRPRLGAGTRGYRPRCRHA